MASRERHPAYLRAVRALPCLVSDGRNQTAKGPWACDGATEAHHAGKNPGLGMKADDTTAVPLCHKHHVMITGDVGGYGIWGWYTPELRREMQDNWIKATQAQLVDVLTGNREIDAY